MATNQGGLMIKTNVLLVAVLLTSACASRPIAAVEESFPPQTQGEEKSTAGHAVAGAAKGALGGAGVCAMPTVAGLYGGPPGPPPGGTHRPFFLPLRAADPAAAPRLPRPAPRDLGSADPPPRHFDPIV